MKQSVFLLLSLLLLVACFPALYTGMMLAAQFDNFLLFPVPCITCMAFMAYTLHKAETL